MGGGDPGAAAIFLGGAHVRKDGGRPGFVHRGRSEARVPAEEAAETVAEVVGGRRRRSGAAPRSLRCCRLSSRLLALHAPRPLAAALRLLVPRRLARPTFPRAVTAAAPACHAQNAAPSDGDGGRVWGILGGGERLAVPRAAVEGPPAARSASIAWSLLHRANPPPAPRTSACARPRAAPARALARAAPVPRRLHAARREGGAG